MVSTLLLTLRKLKKQVSDSVQCRSDETKQAYDSIADMYLTASLLRRSHSSLTRRLPSRFLHRGFLRRFHFRFLNLLQLIEAFSKRFYGDMINGSMHVT